MYVRLTSATYVWRYVLKASIILVLTALIAGAVPFLDAGFIAVACWQCCSHLPWQYENGSKKETRDSPHLASFYCLCTDSHLFARSKMFYSSSVQSFEF